MLSAIVAVILATSGGTPEDMLYRSELDSAAAEIRSDAALATLQHTLNGGNSQALDTVVRDLQLVRRGGQEIADLRKALDDFLGHDLAILADPAAEPGIRRLIARDMGVRLPHPILVPILRLIAHSDEQDRVRAAAAYGMSLIPSSSVIPELISLLRDPSEAVRGIAWEQLGKLTGCTAGIDLNDPTLWDACTNWWDNHEATFQYNRERALELR